MNKTLKWILIGLGIALVVFFVVMFFLGFHRSGYYMMNGIDDYGRGFRTFGRMPMMGIMPLLGLGLLRGVFGLGVLTLAVIGVVLLVRNGKAKKLAHDHTVDQPVDVVSEPVVTCKKCGKELQNDWAVCPYCGKKQ